MVSKKKMVGGVKAKNNVPNKKNQPKSLKASKPLRLQVAQGMRDILPQDQSYWERVRKVLMSTCQEYGFGRIDVPLMEYTNIFEHTLGLTADSNENRFYTFVMKEGDAVSLRPEFTTSIARAYIEHTMSVLPKPVRLFSAGTVYCQADVQADVTRSSHNRECHQANFDVFGEADPILDAQIIHVAQRVLSQLGLKNIEFSINSIGTAENRLEYETIFVRHLEFQKQKLCQNCRERLVSNPLRILDCKEDKCSQLSALAPKFMEYLDQESKDHFKKLQEYLDELEISYSVTPQLVGSAQYYTRTVFEIYAAVSGGEKIVLGRGGRYDKLVQSLGGDEVPAIGFSLVLDRLVAEMQKHHVKLYHESKPKVFLAQLGELAKKKSLKLFSELQKNGILIAESFGRGSLKSQMRVAERLGVEITLILGQKEALDETVILKDMVSGTQETVTQEKLVAVVKKILKSRPSGNAEKIVSE